MRRTSKRSRFGHIKRENGKRSGLETQAALLFEQAGVTAKYEREIGTIEYTDPRVRKYLPDFQLPNGIFVECKGWFKSEDRRKHLLLKQQHPSFDIRFCFSNPNQKISKKSQTTYAMWCEKNGFQFCGIKSPSLAAWAKEKKGS